MVITKNRIEITVEELKELSRLESKPSIQDEHARETARAILGAIRNVTSRTDKDSREPKIIK